MPPTSPPVVATLVGLAAPGLSTPIAGAVDGLTVPEFFLRRAWRSMVADAAEHDAAVTLQAGHGGTVRARCRDGSLSLAVRPPFGLAFVATVREDRPEVRPWLDAFPVAGAAVSIGFRRARSRLVPLDGAFVRVVTAAEIDHLAIVTPRSGFRAIYPGGCVVMADNATPCSLVDAWRRVMVHAHRTAAAAGYSLESLASRLDR